MNKDSYRHQESGGRASNACWGYGSYQEGGAPLPRRTPSHTLDARKIAAAAIAAMPD
ncbi:hypothetical protein [Streptomyces anulatus]|uniref:hypothetical protein n=1 Tax=Streptomyces anulatus TaxID=1892 RepID=UPI0036BF4A48